VYVPVTPSPSDRAKLPRNVCWSGNHDQSVPAVALVTLHPPGRIGSIAGELAAVCSNVAVMVTVSPGATVTWPFACATDTPGAVCALAIPPPAGPRTEVTMSTAKSDAKIRLL
jgi:hypothetical protein